MTPPSVLLNARRPLLALTGALLLLGSAALVARPAAALPLRSGVAAAPDSTGLLAWAGQLGDLRRLLAEAEAAPSPEAPALAAEAFATARSLADDPLSEGDSAVRALLLDAQALYERHHGPVAATALSAGELTLLRGDVLAALPHGDPFTLTVPEAAPAAEALPAPAASLPATLRYPEHAEAAIAREGQRLLRVYGGVRGIERRTRRYFPMIEQALAQRGLPEELKYVAFIESGMDAGAVSPAGALGMWQMLPSTGAMYGLSEGALTHPARSTGAATRYLAYLGELFDGDWQLALAAYNCGPGRVQGLVQRVQRRLGRRPTFWDLYPHLPAETRAYVPRFIAVARAVEGTA
jgi:membrane-bound lytic murein transglycosylase D